MSKTSWMRIFYSCNHFDRYKVSHGHISKFFWGESGGSIPGDCWCGSIKRLQHSWKNLCAVQNTWIIDPDIWEEKDISSALDRFETLFADINKTLW